MIVVVPDYDEEVLLLNLCVASPNEVTQFYVCSFDTTCLSPLTLSSVLLLFTLYGGNNYRCNYYSCYSKRDVIVKNNATGAVMVGIRTTSSNWIASHAKANMLFVPLIQLLTFVVVAIFILLLLVPSTYLLWKSTNTLDLYWCTASKKIRQIPSACIKYCALDNKDKKRVARYSLRAMTTLRRSTYSASFTSSFMITLHITCYAWWCNLPSSYSNVCLSKMCLRVKSW